MFIWLRFSKLQQTTDEEGIDKTLGFAACGANRQFRASDFEFHRGSDVLV